jgi:hypothetical protein
MGALGLTEGARMMAPARAGEDDIKDGVQHLVIDQVRKNHGGHHWRIERRTDRDCTVKGIVVAKSGPTPVATPADFRDIHLAVEKPPIHFVAVTAKRVMLARSKQHLSAATQPPLPH